MIEEEIEKHGFKYIREDLCERKKSPLKQGLLEEDDYYPTLAKGRKQNFEGEIISFTAQEIDTLAEAFFNGNRDRLVTWLDKVDREYKTKPYKEQLGYKGAIINRLNRAQRGFNERTR